MVWTAGAIIWPCCDSWHVEGAWSTWRRRGSGQYGALDEGVLVDARVVDMVLVEEQVIIVNNVDMA